jgi:hypothetical protein
MRAAFALLVLLVTGCGDAPPSVRGKQVSEVTEAPIGAELRETCATVLGDVPIVHDFGTTVAATEVTLQSHARGAEDCFDYAWARGAIVTAVVVEPHWAGPDIVSTGWDCSHSSLEYGVYRAGASGVRYVDGGLGFGELDAQGGCRYSVENVPRQAGSDLTVVTGAQGEATTEVYVGVRAWSHNDPAMGHAGHDCDTESCYWPVRLAWLPY